MFQTLKNYYFSAVIRYPLWVLLAVLSLTVALAGQLGNLKIDASSDALTLEYDKDLDYFREMSKRYDSGDFLVVTYTPQGDLMADNTLSHLRALRDELLTVDGVASANSILDVPLLFSPKVSLLDVAKGIKTLQDEGVDRELARQEFIESPIYRDMLLGPDGKTTALLLNLDIDRTFIRLVRERDALRLQRDTQGLSKAEHERLEIVSKEFLTYSTAASEKSYQRVQDVRAIVDKYKEHADLFLGGVSMISADMVDFISSDIVVFGVGIIIFIVIILSVIFRQWQLVLLPLLTCFFAVIIMLGFLAAIDWRLTIISSNFVALLLIICLMMTIHLMVRYRESRQQHPNAAKEEWLKEAVSMMVKPCVYTVLTTMVAFLSLVVSGIRPVMDFGWMMSISLVVAFFLAFLVIPAGLQWLPAIPAAHKKSSASTEPNDSHEDDNQRAFTLIFSRFTERRGHLIIVLGIIAAIISVVGIKQLEVENRFIDYFHSSTEIHQGMLVIDQQLGGTITLDILLDHQSGVKKTEEVKKSITDEVVVASEDPFSLDSDPFASAPNTSEFSNDGDPFGSDNGAADPFGADPFSGQTDSSSLFSDPYPSYWFTKAGLEKIDGLHRYLEALPEVGKVQSLATAYQVASELNGRALNDFELAVLRRALPDDIAALVVNPYLNVEHDQARITMRVKETDPNLRRAELIEKVKAHVTDELGFDEENVHVTGILVLYNNMLQSLFKSQILTIGAVFFGILMMFLILFRSLTVSLIALVPNMLAALVVLGGMGLLGIPLDMMTITIAAIAGGIGADDAVHYIYRVREEFAVDRDYVATMHRAHASIGRAMYYTSVTVIVGFSILALSKFIPSIYFGLLTGLAMLAAIVSSLTLLPQLLLMCKPFGNTEKREQ